MHERSSFIERVQLFPHPDGAMIALAFGSTFAHTSCDRLNEKRTEMAKPVGSASNPLPERKSGCNIQRAARGEQRVRFARELQSVFAGKPQRQPKRAFRQIGKLHTIGICGIGQQAAERIAYNRSVQWLQVETLRARANGGKQTARRMADEQKKSARGRLFEDFQKSVRSVVIHLIGGIDDGDTPAARARGHAEEAA